MKIVKVKWKQYSLHVAFIFIISVTDSQPLHFLAIWYKRSTIANNYIFFLKPSRILLYPFTQVKFENYLKLTAMELSYMWCNFTFILVHIVAKNTLFHPSLIWLSK